MTIIRQLSLFGIQELYDMEPTQKYDAIISAIDVDAIYHAVTKKSRLGAPEELNYAAMIISMFVRYIERIPMIKDLIKRLKNDIAFKLNCGFLVSDTIPSESSYSRLVTKLEASTLLEKEANLPLYEKKIEDQLDVSFDELRTEVPQDPKWGVKKNSEGKHVFWFGYKGHLAVGTSSQYILKALFSSGNLNDGKVAIPLLKGIEQLSLPSLRYQTMDAGYDFEPVYEQVHRMGHQSVIAYNKRNEGELIGFDKHFAPTCFREHSYRYDSFDTTYETLKYTKPKECRNCPLANEGICQKVYKVKLTQDLRKYTAPARGSKAWKTIFKRRTAVERVNAYLKEFFQLNNVRYRTGKRAKIHFELATLIYNASKLAADRIHAQLNQKQAA